MSHSNATTPVSLKFDAEGLLPAVAQDYLTGQVRMVGFMNREAVEQTLSSGRVTFFSRSKQRLWIKGETSGNFLSVRSIVADCDTDTLLVLVDALGPTCHTGRPSCFFRQLNPDGSLEDLASECVPFLEQLEQTIEARRASTAQKSYTRSLLEAGAVKVSEKLTEEAGELGEALAHESTERVASEAADLLYHLMVGLRLRDVSLRAVIEALDRRTHMSGHAEKASRTPKG
ncbi:MAG: bifunctional phosphoribosyl-AMP cyclohydrolase/phosphoribosyl-ATP diphosphatase HisIE [Polyangiaceae bacterium]|nr:bifunctional phosphoribosyl-AMP cyclohydrolase/phosphoribosyl-ATP diphosphatase HisIE [Polyangiaceae bacterium]